jgi:hypothetical protein
MIKGVPEAMLQDAVITAAQRLGYLVAHFRPGQTARGWRTPVSADGAGFPDLVMLRGPRLIVAECKSPRGRLSAEQDRWLAAFREAGVETWVVREPPRPGEVGLDEAIQFLAREWTEQKVAWEPGCVVCFAPAMVIWRGFSLCGNCSGVAWQIPRDVHDRLSDLEFVRVLEDIFAMLGENENVTHDQAIDRVLAERHLL